MLWFAVFVRLRPTLPEIYAYTVGCSSCEEAIAAVGGLLTLCGGSSLRAVPVPVPPTVLADGAGGVAG